jgi:branched-chain amino acid aminotransferase
VRTWVNGRLVDPADALVSAYDHGLTVGDGVFETTKVVGGRAFALTRHLGRLTRSARGLGLPEPDLGLVRRAVDDVLAANPMAGPGRLRITYTGGVSPLGSERGTAGPTLVVALAPLRPWPASAVVVTAPWVRNERAATAGLKTTSYADNVIALAYARERGADEALLANTLGNVCEGTGSNVFVGLDGRLVTPPLAAGCLAGVTRGLVLEWCDVTEVDIPLAALTTAAEMFLTSATRDVLPVRRLDVRDLPAGPGPLTTAAREAFAARSAADPDP